MTHLIKLYNKDKGLRREIKDTVQFGAKDLFSLLHGGTVALQNHASNSALIAEIRDTNNQLRVVKKTNYELLKLLQKENKMKINAKDLL